MLQELNARCKEVGLKTNAGKTMVMQNTGMLKANLRVGGIDLEESTFMFI